MDPDYTTEMGSIGEHRISSMCRLLIERKYEIHTMFRTRTSAELALQQNEVSGKNERFRFRYTVLRYKLQPLIR